MKKWGRPACFRESRGTVSTRGNVRAVATFPQPVPGRNGGKTGAVALIERGGAEAWAEMHARGENAQEIHELRMSTYAGRPYGGEELLREMEARFQRKWLRSEKKRAEFAKAA